MQHSCRTVRKRSRDLCSLTISLREKTTYERMQLHIKDNIYPLSYKYPHSDLQLYFKDAQRNLMFILRVAPQTLCPESFFPEQLHSQSTMSLKDGATAGKGDTFFIPQSTSCAIPHIRHNPTTAKSGELF